MALSATDLRQWAADQVDMAPHIDTLTKYARESLIVVEFGVRGAVSTWAILTGLPPEGRLWSVEIDGNCQVPPAVTADPRWTFIIGDDLDPTVQAQLPNPVDWVFIDTSHEYEQTVAELAYVLTLSPKAIVMHDYVMEPVLRGWHGVLRARRLARAGERVAVRAGNAGPEMRTVLVTGGAGFIGSYVVEELIERGFKVDVLDTRGRHVPGAVTVLGDVRDAVSTNEAVSRCDGVIHLAGVLGTAEMVANPHPAIEANIHGAVNVFEASAAHGVPVVNIAVGNYWMDNPYSISKDTADRFARVFNTYRGGAITSVRTFDAYGPRQTPAAPFGPSRVRKVVPSFICRALTDQPIEVYGDGTQTIDLIYATDIAKILVAALVRHGAGRPAGRHRSRVRYPDHRAGDRRSRDRGDREGQHRPSSDAPGRATRSADRRAESARRRRPALGWPAAHDRLLRRPTPMSVVLGELRRLGSTAGAAGSRPDVHRTGSPARHDGALPEARLSARRPFAPGAELDAAPARR